MVNNASNAIVGKPSVLGGIFAAPIGTTLPTNESSSLAGAYVPVGYLTDAGLVRGRKVDSDTKRAWGGDPLVILDKGTTRTAKFGFAEYLSTVVQELLHGEDNVTETAATSSAGRKLVVKDKDVVLPHMVWVVQLFYGTATGRIVFPDAQITEFDDITYKDDDIASHPVTLTQFANANGDYALEYWDDGRKVITP